MEIHFLYAGDHYYGFNADRLKSFILNGMKKYKIENVMVTIIYMWRNKLITKKSMEKYCNGKKFEKESVNDDIEKLFEDTQFGNEPDDVVRTYFLPKLSEKELDLVERKDRDFMNTFYWKMDADVDKAEMMLSDPDSKFVCGIGYRKTFTMKNS